MKIGSEGIQFEVVYDLYDRDNDGNLKLIKRNIKKSMTVQSKHDISAVREVPNSQYKPYKNKCEIFYRPENTWYTVVGNIKNIEELLNKEERVVIKGFLR